MDVDEWIFLNETFSKLEQPPQNTEEILKFLFDLIKNNKISCISNIENRIHEIANTNPNFSRAYILQYSEKFRDSWFLYELPLFVHYFFPDNIGFVMSAVRQIDHSSLQKRMIKIQFLRVLIQKCFSNDRNLGDMQSIVTPLMEIADATPYVTNPFRPSDMNKLDTLVDKALRLITNIEDRAHLQDLDIIQIQRNLARFPLIEKYCADFLKHCLGTQKYSPLLELLDELNVKNQALLSEIDDGIYLYEITRNEKCSTSQQLTKNIQDQLTDENRFWTLVTELIIMNRFGSQMIVVKDKKIGVKDLDLEVQLPDRTIILEITVPEMQRDAQILGGGFLASKFDSAIDAKRKQLKHGLETNTNSGIIAENLLFYVIIDGSYTPYAYELIDLFTHNNQKNDLVGGVIIVRRNDRYTSPFVQLSGTIIHNPKGRNKLSKEEENELSRIIFATKKTNR